MKRLIIFFLVFLNYNMMFSQVKKENAKVIFSGEQPITCLKFSPDGKFISFSYEDFKGIYVIDEWGNNVMQVTDLHGAGFGYEWSLDSKSISFRGTMFKSKGKRAQSIYVWDLDTKEVQKISKEFHRIGLPNWQYEKDSKKVVFNENLFIHKTPFSRKIHQQSSLKVARGLTKNLNNSIIFHDDALYMVDYNSTSANRLTDEEVAYNPVWSPEKDKIIYSNWDNLIILNIENKKKNPIGIGIHPVWSPNSEFIYFQSTSYINETLIASDIYKADNTGKQVIKKTNTSNIHEQYPSVSPDGSKLIYSSMNDFNIYQKQLNK